MSETTEACAGHVTAEDLLACDRHPVSETTEAAVEAAARAEALRVALNEVADEMEAEYERRTEAVGAYGQTKIRAALHMGAALIRNRAAEMNGDSRG